MSRHLNNEGQECKTGHIRHSVIAKGEGQMKKVKEGEYA
jgi:hypothetical protein